MSFRDKFHTHTFDGAVVYAESPLSHSPENSPSITSLGYFMNDSAQHTSDDELLNTDNYRDRELHWPNHDRHLDRNDVWSCDFHKDTPIADKKCVNSLQAHTLQSLSNYHQDSKGKPQQDYLQLQVMPRKIVSPEQNISANAQPFRISSALVGSSNQLGYREASRAAPLEGRFLIERTTEVTTREAEEHFFSSGVGIDETTEGDFENPSNAALKANWVTDTVLSAKKEEFKVPSSWVQRFRNSQLQSASDLIQELDSHKDIFVQRNHRLARDEYYKRMHATEGISPAIKKKVRGRIHQRLKSHKAALNDAADKISKHWLATECLKNLM